jgi:tetratricopeptide (TPR) repeat protein
MTIRSSLARNTLLTLAVVSACAVAPVAGRAATGLPARSAARTAPDGSAGEYLSGQFALSQSDLDFAADEFLRALSAQPDSAELRHQAFLTCLLAGRPEATRLAQLQSDDQTALLLLGNTDALNGSWDAARARFAALSDQGPTQVLRPLLLAWSQAGAGQFEAALASLEPLVQGQHFRAVYALHAAMVADLAGRSGDAARLYRVAQGEYGSMNLQLVRLLASWQARSGHAAEAEKTLDTLSGGGGELAMVVPALRADMSQRVVRRATDGIAEAYLALAAALRAQDASEFSAVLLRLALELRPDFTAARLLMAEVVDGGKHPEAALAVLAPIAANDPLSGIVRLRRASLTERMGNTQEALRILDDLARDYPDRPEPLTMQGDMLRGEQRYSDAAEAYDKAMARLAPAAPYNWTLFYNRGVALERAHVWNRAQPDLEKALELAPDEPYVLNYLAYSWTERGENLPRARAMLERAVAERPTDGSIIDSLGWVMLRQGDVAGAVKQLERATELMPEDATINGHLGDAYAAAGRKLEAQYQWRLALSFKPDPEDVPKLEAKLRGIDQAQGEAAPAVNAVQ